MKWSGQLFRYAVVGVVTNTGGLLAYFLLTILGASPIVAISILYPIQISLAFFLNKKWSFGDRGHLTGPAVKYLTSYAACYLLNVAALNFFAGNLGLSHLGVQAAAVVVFAALLFLAQKYWVFKRAGFSVSVKNAS